MKGLSIGRRDVIFFTSVAVLVLGATLPAQISAETIAVIGTPLDQAYPRKHASLQQQIMQKHPMSLAYVFVPFLVAAPLLSEQNCTLRSKTSEATMKCHLSSERSDLPSGEHLKVIASGPLPLVARTEFRVSLLRLAYDERATQD